MPPVGFDLTISADERPQNYALGRADTDRPSLHIRQDKSEGLKINIQYETAQFVVDQKRTYTAKRMF
jgi:hypothetical protein